MGEARREPRHLPCQAAPHQRAGESQARAARRARGAVPTNAPQRLRLIGAGGKVQKGTFLTVEALEGDVVRLESGQSFAGPELLKHTRLCSAITCASVQD